MIVELIRSKIESIEIKDKETAEKIVKVVPQSCPFARKIQVGTFKVTIPPLCKVNPMYDQLMELRFRALCYLEGNHEAQS